MTSSSDRGSELSVAASSGLGGDSEPPDALDPLGSSDAASSDWFGYSSAISGDTVVVGAYGNDHGAAYVFVEPAGGWGGSSTENAKLTASDEGNFESFGRSIAVSGDTVVVGAYHNDGGGGANSGSAYAFDFDFEPGLIFEDGFESGDTSAWSTTVE